MLKDVITPVGQISGFVYAQVVNITSSVFVLQENTHCFRSCHWPSVLLLWDTQVKELTKPTQHFECRFCCKRQ
ncbi:hypothetical protein I79_014242 [Cricetulus griseus]|uniref:Uncharacterized protein n=1 Tax=Cricetulus griseus TaxID=10029 RepID=G3HTL4_CRIGR|nr:hypothetical protein I79_014242 [Cricetulus griseus]